MQRHAFKDNYTKDTLAIYPQKSMEITYLNFYANLQGGNDFIYWFLSWGILLITATDFLPDT